MTKIEILLSSMNFFFFIFDDFTNDAIDTAHLIIFHLLMKLYKKQNINNELINY